MKQPKQISYHCTTFGWQIGFQAMASPCEVLINHPDEQVAKLIGDAVAHEAWRIEDKYSRYLSTSVCSAINESAGRGINIDDETYKLLKFAEQCYQLSDEKFDITSGVLRNVWHFDGSDNVPCLNSVKPLLAFIGWSKVELSPKRIVLPLGMELDFGGFGKEYAVDCCLQIAQTISTAPMLINFGGDIVCNSPQIGNVPWHVGIEHPSFAGKQQVVIDISQGAIATSGDARRFLLKSGVRYSHVLDPKTGCSIIDAPKSISVLAPNCIQAGFLATLALLKGKKAQTFLTEQKIQHWCIW